MRKFDSYPIYINHPGRWMKAWQNQREYYEFQRDEAYRTGRDPREYQRMESWFDYIGKRLFEITEDKTPAYETRTWEQNVYQVLLLIQSTRVGKLVLDSLDMNKRYWIVPWLDPRELDPTNKIKFCECGGARVFPGPAKAGGGIRLYMDLSQRNFVQKKWLGQDDVLFHELVHAYRVGRVGYDQVNQSRAMKDNENTEEFLALQLQNVYLTNRKASKYYLTYNDPYTPVLKSKAYEHYAKDGETLAAFRYWVENDHVAREVARWMSPPDSFNPFRDRNVLERMFTSTRGKVPVL